MRTYFEPELANNLDDDFSNISGGGRGGFGGGRPMGGGGMRTPMGGGMRTPSPRTAPSAPRTRTSSPTAPSAPSAPITRSASPSTISAPSAPRTRTPQQIHNRMVRRGLRPYYGGGYGRGYRRFGMTPYGRRWWLGGGGWLFGYPYEFLYPFFYDLSLGVYEEEALKEKYNISDEDWDILMDKLIRGKYINYNY